MHLSAGGGSRSWVFTPHKRSMITPLFYNEIVSCLFSDVGYTIDGRVLNNWNRILLKLQKLQTMEAKLKLLISSRYYSADISLRYYHNRMLKAAAPPPPPVRHPCVFGLHIDYKLVCVILMSKKLKNHHTATSLLFFLFSLSIGAFPYLFAW